MSTAPNLEDLIAAIVIRKFPALALLGTHTYRVVKVYDDAPNYGRCDLESLDEALTKLPRVDQWPGIPGGVGLPAVGSTVEVAFRESKQTQPVIVGFTPLRSTGGTPTKTRLDASDLIEIGPSVTAIKLAGTGPAVARVDDTVDCGGFSATSVAPGSPIIFAYIAPGVAPPVGPPGSFVAITGKITSGSSKVTSG
jgi:hypothetical protein